MQPQLFFVIKHLGLPNWSQPDDASDPNGLPKRIGTTARSTGEKEAKSNFSLFLILR
jgi:hypothetical protein